MLEERTLSVVVYVYDAPTVTTGGFTDKPGLALPPHAVSARATTSDTGTALTACRPGILRRSLRGTGPRLTTRPKA